MSGKAEDPFSLLANELHTLTTQVAALQRTSLNKDEARKLHRDLIEGVQAMRGMGNTVHQAIQEDLRHTASQIEMRAVKAATEAAEGALAGLRAEVNQTSTLWLKNAMAARKEALYAFGGGVAVFGGLVALGAVLGLVGAFLLFGRGDAKQFGKHPVIFCLPAGGQIVEQADGSKYCAVGIKR
jgi:polyhydroxyalkanoate synthesis regulator phasin